MAGQQIRAGRMYRTGARGCTVRLWNGAMRNLPAHEFVVFDTTVEVISGRLTETTSNTKQRHVYSDKQLRGYEDKSA